MTQYGAEIRGNTERVECRSTGQSNIIEGYGAVFNSVSRRLPQGFVEVVSKSFFNKHFGDDQFRSVRSLYDHKSEFLLASVRSGTLDLEIRDKGLFYRAELPQSRSDVYELIATGRVDGSSFQFVCMDDAWDFVDGQTQRTLISGKLLETGPTSTPAYESAGVGVALRSFAANFDADLTEVERDAKAGDLRRYFKRSDVPTPLVVAQRNVKEDNMGMDTDLARRMLKNRMDRDAGMDTELAMRMLQNRKRRMDWEAEEYAARTSTRQQYQPEDPNAAWRQQQDAMLKEATRRRLNHFAQEGKYLPEQGYVPTHHGPAGPVVMTPRQQKPVNDGWLGA